MVSKVRWSLRDRESRYRVFVVYNVQKKDFFHLETSYVKLIPPPISHKTVKGYLQTILFRFTVVHTLLPLTHLVPFSLLTEHMNIL